MVLAAAGQRHSSTTATNSPSVEKRADEMLGVARDRVPVGRVELERGALVVLHEAAVRVAEEGLVRAQQNVRHDPDREHVDQRPVPLLPAGLEDLGRDVPAQEARGESLWAGNTAAQQQQQLVASPFPRTRESRTGPAAGRPSRPWRPCRSRRRGCPSRGARRLRCSRRGR